jgi:hypothetical protein
MSLVDITSPCVNEESIDGTKIFSIFILAKGKRPDHKLFINLSNLSKKLNLKNHGWDCPPQKVFEAILWDDMFIDLIDY